MGGVTRLNQLPDGSGILSSDDIFLMMDDPSGSAVTKKVSLAALSSTISQDSITPNVQTISSASGTINTDVSLYNVFNINLVGSGTLAAPSNSSDGQRSLWRVKRSNGQVLTLHDNFRIINSGVINNSAHSTTFIDGIYDNGDNKWDSIVYNNLPTIPPSSTLFLTMDASPFVDSIDAGRTIEVTPTAVLDTVNTRVGAGSLSVDQNGHLYSTDVADIDISGDFTISLSIKPTGVPGAGYGFPFVTTTLSNGNTNGLFLTWNLSASGTLIIGQVNTSNIATSAAGVAPIDEWTDIVVTRSGSTIKIFANSAPVATGTSSFAFQCSRLNIGEGDNVGAGAGFIGNIDEFKIINGQAIEP